MPRRRFSLAALWLSMLWLLCLCLPARADRDDLNALQAPAPSQWQLIKDDKPRNIQIFSKREDHTRVRSMKAEAELPGSVAGMVDVLMDFERYPLWFWRLKEIRPLKQLSATEAYVYAVFSPPMGFPDRDVVLHYKAEIVRNGQRAMVTATSVPNLMPEQPGRVRMPYARMESWIAHVDTTKVYFKGEVVMDPGGNLPIWASNFVQRQGPYITMLNLLKVLGSES